MFLPFKLLTDVVALLTGWQMLACGVHTNFLLPATSSVSVPRVPLALPYASETTASSYPPFPFACFLAGNTGHHYVCLILFV